MCFKNGRNSAPLLLLLHGSNLDELLIIAVLAYLVIMFILAQLKTRRLRREKLLRKAERAALRKSEVESGADNSSEPKL